MTQSDNPRSDCHNAPTKLSGGVGDFRDSDLPVTMYYICTECDEPCDLAQLDDSKNTGKNNYMQVIEGSERCLGGHPIVQKVMDGTPWLCADETCEYSVKNVEPNPPKTGDVMELDELFENRSYVHLSCGIDADPEDGYGYCTCGVDEMVKSAKSKLTKYTEQVKKNTASEIFSLAHEYAQNDKTMIGSENLRAYHYYNAIHKIGGFDGR